MNAWSVGAKTVNGPSPWSVVTRFAWVSAATRESWTPVAAAVDGIYSVATAYTRIGSVEIIRLAKIRVV